MNGVTSLLKGRWSIWVLALFFSLLAGFGALSIVGKAADQVTYYVLKSDVPARTQITEDLLIARTVNADGRPPLALPLDQLKSGEIFTLVPLQRGDVLSASVAGPLQKIESALPPDYVLASLSIAPEDAVGGRISAGDYVDIIGVFEEGSKTAKVVLRNVYVMDVTVDPQTIAEAASSEVPVEDKPGIDNPKIRGGIPQIYTFAVLPQDFAKLALLRDLDVYLAISSKSPTSTGVDVSISETVMSQPGFVNDSSSGFKKSSTANTAPSSDATVEEPAADPAAQEGATPAPEQTTTAP